MNNHKETGCIASSEELRKLIMENPDLPIMVEVETDVVLDGTYFFYIAPSVHFRIDEVLDCEQDINQERIYYDRSEFEDWNGMGGKQVVAPKGTFEAIYNDTEND